jgi:hypothetical protein
MSGAPGRATPAAQLTGIRETTGSSNSLIPPSPQDRTPLWVWMRRTAARWRYRDGEAIATIAVRLGCTEATVRDLLGEGAP